MLYRDIEVEKYYDVPSTDPRKKDKIKNAIKTDLYIASIKKDGEYIRAIYDTDGEIWIIGRGTNALKVHNLDKHLVFITEWLKENFKPGTCIIGELHVPGKTSRAIRAYTGSLVPKSLLNQKNCPPQYYVHDVWGVNGVDLMNTPYHERIMYIMFGKEFIDVSSQIETAWYVSGVEEITDYIAAALADGEEGCVLVNRNSVVAPGKRTAWKTIKAKKEFTDNIDCFFTGNSRPPTRDYTGSELENWKYWENIRTKEIIYENCYNIYLCGTPVEPVTKPYALGWPGSLEVGVYKGNEVASLCYLSGLTDSLKADFAKDNKDIIMRPIQINGMESTDASIRHPKFVGFRDDISMEDCQYNKIFGGN